MDPDMAGSMPNHLLAQVAHFQYDSAAARKEFP
jgi:hypothetical protein